MKIFSTRIFCIFSLILGSCIPSFSYASGDFVYPFDKIATPACKWNAWSTLGDDCKMTLPRIEWANYSAYKDNTLYRRVYSVLWGATYDYGWDTGFGGHTGVDIPTAEWTPVRAIGDGEVVIAGWLNGWGNVVSIKHTLTDGTKIWSNYAHLSKISVTKGSTVKQLDQIGAVGNTGNSYGNHLHFQIDTGGSFHPFYFGSCAKGIGEMGSVNGTMCRSELLSNTVDPIAFIESGKLVTTVTQSTVNQVQSKPVIKIEQKTIKSRAEILEDEMKEFLSRVNFSFGIPESGVNVPVGTSIASSVSFTDPVRKGRGVQGNLPEAGLEFVYDKKALKVFPDKIVGLDGGKRTFTVTSLKAGAYPITLKMGSSIVASRTIFSLSATDQKSPTSMEIRTPTSMTMGADGRIYIVPRTKYGTPILDTNYGGSYILRSKKPWVRFCNISKKDVKTCGYDEFVTEVPFTVKNTYRGVLDVLIRTGNYSGIDLEVVVNNAKYSAIGKSKKSITIKLPKDVDTKTAYGTASASALEKWLFPLYNKDYLAGNRTISGKDARDLAKRLLLVKLGNTADITRKKGIREKIANIDKKFPNVPTQATITRAEFATLILFANGDPLVDAKDSGYLDEKWDFKTVMWALRSIYNFKWQDSFGSYFQPNKAITVEEALYMVEKVGKQK